MSAIIKLSHRETLNSVVIVATATCGRAGHQCHDVAEVLEPDNPNPSIHLLSSNGITTLGMMEKIVKYVKNPPWLCFGIYSPRIKNFIGVCRGDSKAQVREEDRVLVCVPISPNDFERFTANDDNDFMNRYLDLGDAMAAEQSTVDQS